MDLQNNKPQTNIIQIQQTVKKIQHYLFKWSNHIGKGNFSDVYLGINEKNQQQVAIKLIKNQSIKSKTAQRLLNHQILNLKYMDHPNIIKCFDVISSVNNCYIITEFCQGGDLEKILKQKGKFQEYQINKIVYQTFKGLQYLHNNHVIHRDFKIANIFIKNNSYKIADFGFSIKAKNEFKDIEVGSPIYMSPQGYINNIYGPKTDVWSFGVMIYQLLHGYAPLDKCKSVQQLKINIVKKPLHRKSLSKQVIQLIERCLQPNLSQRISIRQILQTDYMKRIFSLFESSSIIPQKLSQTFHSTQTSNSNQQNIFQRNFTYDESLSIIHYGRLLNLCYHQTKLVVFSQWLLKIYQGFVKCKIIQSTSQQQTSPKNGVNLLSKNVPSNTEGQNLKKIIHQYSAKYIIEHVSSMKNSNNSFTFETILSECTKLYKQYEQRKSFSQIKNLIFMVYKQTELLNQSFKQNKMAYFAKHSKSSHFINQLKKKSNPTT